MNNNPILFEKSIKQNDDNAAGQNSIWMYYSINMRIIISLTLLIMHELHAIIKPC